MTDEGTRRQDQSTPRFPNEDGNDLRRVSGSGWPMTCIVIEKGGSGEVQNEAWAVQWESTLRLVPNSPPDYLFPFLPLSLQSQSFPKIHSLSLSFSNYVSIFIFSNNLKNALIMFERNPKIIKPIKQNSKNLDNCIEIFGLCIWS